MSRDGRNLQCSHTQLSSVLYELASDIPCASCLEHPPTLFLPPQLGLLDSQACLSTSQTLASILDLLDVQRSVYFADEQDVLHHLLSAPEELLVPKLVAVSMIGVCRSRLGA